MCAGSQQPPRPSLRAGWRNFAESDLPVWDRLRLLWSNSARKARLRQSCCGHYGEPGC